MTEKGGLLYVGSHGTAIADAVTGNLTNRNRQWIKTVTKEVSDSVFYNLIRVPGAGPKNFGGGE